MEVLSIQGLIGKLQAHKEIVNEIKIDMVHKNAFQREIVMDIPKKVEGVNKDEEK